MCARRLRTGDADRDGLPADDRDPRAGPGITPKSGRRTGEAGMPGRCPQSRWSGGRTAAWSDSRSADSATRRPRVCARSANEIRPPDVSRCVSVVVRGVPMLLLVAALAGCGTDVAQPQSSSTTRSDGASTAPGSVTADDGSASTMDCQALIRYDGRTYSAVSPEIKTSGAASWAELPGEVETSDCDDVGEDARGAHFAESANTYPAVELPGVELERAVGYRVELQNRTAVVLAVSTALSNADRDALWERFVTR
jgi:hypothetical protein